MKVLHTYLIRKVLIQIWKQVIYFTCVNFTYINLILIFHELKTNNPQREFSISEVKKSNRRAHYTSFKMSEHKSMSYLRRALNEPIRSSQVSLKSRLTFYFLVKSRLTCWNTNRINRSFFGQGCSSGRACRANTYSSSAHLKMGRAEKERSKPFI